MFYRVKEEHSNSPRLSSCGKLVNLDKNSTDIIEIQKWGDNHILVSYPINCKIPEMLFCGSKSDCERELNKIHLELSNGSKNGC